jgi:hypothetical protein
MPSTIITKTCLTKDGEEEPFPAQPLKIYPTQNLVVSDTIYSVQFQPDQMSREYECIMHSFNSWKDPAQLRALQVYAKGRVPYYRFHCEGCRNFHPNKISGWIRCDKCQQVICSKCAKLVQKNILSDNAVPLTIKQNNVWLHLVKRFIQIDPPKGFKSILNKPPSISHCCRLTVEVNHKHNILSGSQKKSNMRNEQRVSIVA